MARGGRQFGGPAVDLPRSQDEVASTTTPTHVSRAFLVKKPGENKWRLVVDFRWMNSFCVKSKVKMETLKKLRPLVEPGDWCFSFDLQDGYHAVGIDPDFQKCMQFDLQGELFQCTALPFGWSDAPRIFVKFMKVLVEALRSPGAAEDRRELLKLINGRVAAPRYEVRRRAGGVHRDLQQRGARVLPYMDDLLILTSTEEEAFVQRERVRRVLARLGLSRNEKKGQWEPGQLIEHIGMEVDLKEGLFWVTETRINKIHAQARSIICDATREKRWLSERRLAAFNGLCQSIFLAVPAARMYLRELYFVLSTKRSWGAKVKLTRQSLHDLEWWLRLPVMSRWNGRKIWRSPTRAKLHTDSSLRAWGGVLNLSKEARGFWPDDLRHLHITQLELEAVYKTVQAFMRELEGKVVRLYCDNQAVVAMLSHFTSRIPELMRRMRKLWLLLDLHDIELQARYIRSEANEWADRLSRCEDIDDWRLNRQWFEWADNSWGPHTVDRFASEISAQLPRYFAGWHDPLCEGVDSMTYDWRGENNWVNPPWGLLDEEGSVRAQQAGWISAARDVEVGRGHVPHPPHAVSNCGEGGLQQTVPAGTRLLLYWGLGDAWYPGVVQFYDNDGFANIVYDDGDKEVVDLTEERFSIIANVENPIGEKNIFGEKDIVLTDGVGTSDPPVGTEKNQIKKEGFLEKAFGLRWRKELGISEHSELAVRMQEAALQQTTKDDYEPKVKKFVLFCQRQQKEWLPATTPTVLLYLALLLEAEGIRASSLQPYLSAINNYPEDLGYEAPAKGRSVTCAVKGMAMLQANEGVVSGDILTERTYLPAQHVWAAQQAAAASTPRTTEELQQLRAYVCTVFANVTFRRPDTGVAMQTEHISSTEEVLSVVLLKKKGRRHHQGATLANEWIQLALDSLGCLPPEGGHFSAHSTRKGAATGARAVGTVLERVCFFGGWSQTSSVVHRYIDPTAIPDEYMQHFFGWMAPQGNCG
ncbi:hypothetical protein CYMTET_55334 [Cymbomonas tetramitiformis]|uniref:Reverse transcriptase domain-containing protein n=1 Tax=Cymbomonas tetramitiformis TaxID=36881 RepID=A0AAE0BDI0_9CHLO|nr:hypothetical protein CYMTET_55334 [Cymbomonas tetramitiformis]